MNLMRECDWFNIDYLAGGTPTQRAAYKVLKQAKLFEQLSKFHPVLVGTIPLDVDIPGSDLDILCEVYDFSRYTTLIQKYFGHHQNLHQKTKQLNGVSSLVSRFIVCDLTLELVAQPIPVRQQRAYLHMIAEAQLLVQGGASAREAIRTLKLSGLKTEPAFAHYFGLDGDPYLALLELA